MEWYWILGIAVVVGFFIGIVIEGIIDKEKRGNGASSIVGALASILFVLIMIYDKL